MYMRYVLGFVSSYILVAFTLERLTVITWPLSQTFKRKKNSWFIVSLIVCLGLTLNVWSPLMFGINESETESFSRHSNQTVKLQAVKYCDASRFLSHVYFKITAVYIVLTTLVPIVIIFVSNILIILQVLKADSKRKVTLTAGSTAATAQLITATATSTAAQPNRSNSKAKLPTMIALTHLKVSDPFEEKRLSTTTNSHHSNSSLCIEHSEVVKSHSSPSFSSQTRRMKPYYHSRNELVSNNGNRMSGGSSSIANGEDIKYLSTVLVFVSRLCPIRFL